MSILPRLFTAVSGAPPEDDTTPPVGALHRREFMLGLGSALLLTACGGSGKDTDGGVTADAGTDADAGGGTPGFNPLWIPPTLSGADLALSLAPSSKQLRAGAATPTYAYNGGELWGPTLLLTKGETVRIDVTNHLTEDTTTHWHGVHLPAGMDGGPHQVIAPGATWSPSFEVKNNAGTYWYHPHLHMTTMAQLNLGAGGFIIVRDAAEAALPLPRTYGVDDLPLVLTSRRFNADNSLSTATIYGDYLLANGTPNAEVALPAQFVRLRILNAEIERAYDLGFADGRTFHVIGTDGGLLSAPVAVTRLLMAPGERYELLVDLTAEAIGASLTLQSFNRGQPFGFPGGETATSGEFGSLLNNTTFDVLRINVAAATTDGITALPATLVANTYWTAADATNARTLNITDMGPGTPFTFDGVGFDHATINQTVTLNAIEQWTVANGRIFGHSFHIHDEQFAIVSRSTGPVPEHERGWKDTFFVRIGESVSFVARFDDYASPTDAFMYHCHMANHEDGGLMGQFLVVA